MQMRYCGISFNLVNMTHIDQLSPMDKLLMYIAIDDGIFYHKEHGDLFEREFQNGCLYKLLDDCKAYGYVDDVPDHNIWFLTNNGIKQVKNIISEHRVDAGTVRFIHDNALHDEAKQIIACVKNI